MAIQVRKESISSYNLLWQDKEKKMTPTDKDIERDLINKFDPPAHHDSKFDAGKNRLSLVLGDFARAIDAVGMVGTKGAQKYSDHGWLHVSNGIERYTDAMLRHLNKDHQGEFMDDELQLPHAACTAWNALARLELILRKVEEDNESTE
jgi:hypothetical protein